MPAGPAASSSSSRRRGLFAAGASADSRVHEVAEREEETHQHDGLEDLLRQLKSRPSSITVISISGKKMGRA